MTFEVIIDRLPTSGATMENLLQTVRLLREQVQNVPVSEHEQEVRATMRKVEELRAEIARRQRENV